MDRFMDGLREAGSYSSSGHFTIGWEKASEKLRQFQAGDRRAFLLLFISAGTALGARNISITEDEHQLEVLLHGCYISQENLRDGFLAIASGNAPDYLLDLAMGLHGGLNSGIYVELKISAPEQPSFHWKLTEETEESRPTQTVGSEPVVCAVFHKRRKVLEESLWKRLLGWGRETSNLGGYVGLSEPCQLVDKRCDKSPIPISIGRQLVSRPFYLPSNDAACRVGTVGPQLQFQTSHVLNLPDFAWSGGLVLQPGELRCVVHGVSYPPLTHPSLDGVLWVDINRDLSRSRLITNDAKYESLQQDLNQIEKAMLDWAD